MILNNNLRWVAHHRHSNIINTIAYLEYYKRSNTQNYKMICIKLQDMGKFEIRVKAVGESWCVQIVCLY